LDNQNKEMSKKQKAACDSLPKELRREFDRIVEDYKFAATLRYNRPFVSYIVLADIIRTGWRRVADPIENNAEENEEK